MNIDKIIKVIVTILLVGYVIYLFIVEFDSSKLKQTITTATEEFVYYQIIDYVKGKQDYYYPINGSTYCINKADLVDTLDSKVINNIPTNIIEINYNDGYMVRYNDNCIEN